MDRVLAVLAGDRVSQDWLTPWLARADQILAADGGADLVVQSGFVPDVLVGDLDSVTTIGRAHSRLVIETPDPDHSDCEKLLGYAASRGLLDLVLCGMEGSRIDHSLYALQCVARWPGRCLLAYETMLGVVLKAGQTVLVESRDTISAIPLEACMGVCMTGVKWPLTNVTMSASQFASISNVGQGHATVSIESGTLLVVWGYDGAPTWEVALAARI